MNIEYKSGNDSETKSLKEALGSHYALQVALQTMKERCQNLQLRLATVEEENLILRKKKESHQSEMKHEIALHGSPEVELLNEKISQLMHQKSQLSHHICMVSTENQQLWNRLSRVTQANQSLGSHLTKISDTLVQHSSSGILKDDESTWTCKLEGHKDSNTESNDDITDQSLDEISLKIISSLMQEKAELEDQYLQMVDIQSDKSFPIRDLGFPFLDNEDESIINEVNKQCQKMLEMKCVLAEQRNILKTALKNLEDMKVGGMLCQECSRSLKSCMPGDSGENQAPFDTLNMTKLQNQSDENISLPEDINRAAIPVDTTPMIHNENVNLKNDHICPMCGRIYSEISSFETFQKHVQNHFTDDIDPILNNFEVIT